MIDPAVLLTLETKNEIHIAILLSTSGEPMRHFPVYAAESIVSIEKMTGKTVKMFEFSFDQTAMTVDGQTRTDHKQKVSILFVDPPTVSVTDTSVKVESRPLIDLAETKQGKSKAKSKPTDEGSSGRL